MPSMQGRMRRRGSRRRCWWAGPMICRAAGGHWMWRVVLGEMPFGSRCAGWRWRWPIFRTSARALAGERAALADVAVQTIEIDLEREPLEARPFDLIVSICYLCRSLFAEFQRLLAAGGTLVVIQPTKRNLERNEKPPAAYLLDEG